MWQFSWKSDKKNFDPFFKTFEDEDEDEKIWGKDFNFWILHIKFMLCHSIYENPRNFFLTQLCYTFLVNQSKNGDEYEKIRKNDFDFWILHIKIRLCGSFHENLRKKFLTHFVRHFWLMEAKMKMKIKIFGKKWVPSFEFSISILGYLWKGLILSHKGNWWNKTNFCFLEFKKAFNDTQEVVKCLPFIPNFDKPFKTHRKTPLTSNPLSKDLWIAWVAQKSWLMSQPSLKPDWFLKIRLLSIRYLFI